MKVGIDVSITGVNQAGTGAYVRSLVEALRGLDGGDQYLTFSVGQRLDMAQHKSTIARLGTLYRDIVWTHGLLPGKARLAGIDLLHMPANVIPVISPGPTVVTILDTTVLQMPARFTRWHRSYSRVFIPMSARRAARIVTISDHSKRDIVRQCNVSPDKVVVTHLAASRSFRSLPKAAVLPVVGRYGLRPYILVVGTLEPRKNTIRLLQAYARLRDDGCDQMLVHVGPPGWLSDDVGPEVTRLGLQDSVRFLGRVPLDDLVALYNGASLFAYPSLYEGFGLPVLEAMACGCPVVTSNTSSLPEIAGDGAILVDPQSVAELAAAMRRVLDDGSLADDLRQRGLVRAALFSWERCARETRDVYHGAIES